MPLTPFHYPVAYVISKLDRKLSLPALAVGSMLPDIEIPLMFLLFGFDYHHSLVLHSLVGAAIFGTIFTVLLTNIVYPYFISALFRIDRRKVGRRCSLSLHLVFSGFLGVLSHVLLDLVNHAYRPILWPFSQSTISIVCSALGGPQNASLIAHTVLLGLFGVIVATQRENIREKLLVGD